LTDSQQNGSKDERGSVLRAEEATVTAILQSKLTLQECLRENDRQLVAYRIAEIMVAAKELYTKELPRIAADRAETEEDVDIFSELAGLRMSFLHLRDLITDFDESFMIAMSHQREDDEEEAEEEDEQDESESDSDSEDASDD
tara:strand:+ start:49 stop:477 length:429 start_codon:yes stop_codon:yes gene_type:complete